MGVCARLSLGLGRRRASCDPGQSQRDRRVGAARASDSEASLERVVISRLATVVVRHHGQELARCRSASSEKTREMSHGRTLGPRTRRRSAPASVGVGRRVGGRPRSSGVALVPRAALLLVPSHSRRDRIRRRGEPRAGRPTVVRPSGEWRVAQSVSQSVSYFTVLPRAHPSTGSQSGSAAPVQPQVPSTNP